MSRRTDRSWGRAMPLILLSGLCLSLAMADGLPMPPETRMIDHVDDYHGTQVADPYRWLEDDVRESEDVAAWVEAENVYTNAYLEQLPHREAIRERLTALWDFAKFGTPFKVGGRYYFEKNDGLQNQYVLYVQDSLDSEPRVLIDPNEWSDDGTIALGETVFSDDGRYLTYGIQDGGSDWRTWKILEIESGRLLDDELTWIKFNSPSWTADGNGFFYGRYPTPQEGQEFQNLNLNMQIYYHRVGTSQDADVLVFERPDEPEWGFGCDVTEDGRYLVITTWKGTDDKYRVFVKDLHEPFGMPYALIDHFDNEYTLIGNDGPTLFFKTDLDAPLKRVIAIDLRNPQPENYREVIPQGTEPITSVSLVGNVFFVEALKDAKTQVRLFDMQGSFLREVEFPGIGTAGGFGGTRGDTETFYSFSSFATPPSTYRYDVLTGESTLLQRSNVDMDPEGYVVEQVFYESKDGTRVPMFIAHRKGIELDGTNPTLLYGYGGFNIPLTPTFSISRLAWMEMGGVLAVAEPAWWR